MTPYETIYDRFLRKISDYEFASLGEETMTDMMNGWLHSAFAKTPKMFRSISLDDSNEKFSTDLTELQIEVLALGMVIEWITPMINSVNLTMQMFGGKEEKFYAQANHLDALQKVSDSAKEERRRLIVSHTIDNNSYLTEE